MSTSPLAYPFAVSKGAIVLLEKGLADLPDSLLTHQPPSLPNHALWTLGHLTFVRANVARAIGATFTLPDSYAALFAPGSTPSPDLTAYPPKAELLATFHQAHTALVDQAASLSPEQLSAPTPIERIRHRFPTVGDLLTGILIFHDGFHLGQLAAWRSAQKLPKIL